MLDSSNRYAVAGRDFLTNARQYLQEGDLVQASEKGWGAAAVMVKAVAEERGCPHRHHRLLYGIIEDLVDETGDEELSEFFHAASRLHYNFYEDWLRPQVVQRHLQQVGQLVEKLDLLLAK